MLTIAVKGCLYSLVTPGLVKRGLLKLWGWEREEVIRDTGKRVTYRGVSIWTVPGVSFAISSVQDKADSGCEGCMVCVYVPVCVPAS